MATANHKVIYLTEQFSLLRFIFSIIGLLRLLFGIRDSTRAMLIIIDMLIDSFTSPTELAA